VKGQTNETHLMKTTILRNVFVDLAAIFALTQLLAAGTIDGKGLTGMGNALPGTVIVVTNTNDSGPGSLRDALAAASDGDTIDATGVSGTILLTSGELQINHDVIINGPGAGNLAVNGRGIFRVFENFASDATISGFTITNGFTTDADGGGGILNHGGLKLSGTSILRNNTGSCGGSCSGGGINSNSGGTLKVTNCIIGDNSANLSVYSSGGGMYLVGGGTVTITDSTISNNGAGFAGGGIFSSLHMLTVTNSTISNNSAEFGLGGGIYGSLMTMVRNSTISGNTARGGGGGMSTGGTATITNSTISDNSTPSRGGALLSFGAATIGDTILNAGASGGTIANSGTFTSLGYNLASDSGGGVLTGPGDQINTNPMLGPLQDNGGPTFTQALLPGSPAINAGVPIFITPPPRYDQRGPGFPRVVHGRIDIGSFEVQR
jgi:hypothetical protein